MYAQKQIQGERNIRERKKKNSRKVILTVTLKQFTTLASARLSLPLSQIFHHPANYSLGHFSGAGNLNLKLGEVLAIPNHSQHISKLYLLSG